MPAGLDTTQQTFRLCGSLHCLKKARRGLPRRESTINTGVGTTAYGRHVPSELVNETVGRLARRKPIRAEAETQADIYMLLTTAGLGLDPDDVVKIESQVADGTRRRIDIEAGHVVIEVKKDLTVGNLADYEQQLAGYVQ